MRNDSRNKSGPPRNGMALKDVPGGIPEEHKFLKELLISYIHDMSCILDYYHGFEHDIRTINNRFEAEGFGFISKTLPLFSDWLRSSIDAGTCLPFPSFKNYRNKYVEYPYPAFLRGLVCRIFNADGELIVAIDPYTKDQQTESLKAINTICNSFGKKYEVPLSEEKLDRQMRDLIAFDETVFKAGDFEKLSPYAQDVAAFARFLVKDIFDQVITMRAREHSGVYSPWSHSAMHGSGSVAFPLLPHEKYTCFTGDPISFGLGKSPVTNNPSFTWWFNDHHKSGISPLAEFSNKIGGISRLVIVPKNSKKGREICCEPVENQFYQQGLRMSLYDRIETHPYTRGLVHFNDQSVNRSLALAASCSGARATLDIKSASNSVSLALVNLLWPASVRDVLIQVRSNFMMAPFKAFKSGVQCSEVFGVFRPNMFAPMGSAVCFPVEALTFWAILTAHLHLSGARDERVWIYGDDIILANEHAESAAQILAEFKIKVNEDKSFFRGLFRESCGVDAFDGSDITPPARLSTRLPLRLFRLRADQKSRSIVAWVTYANRFEANGCPTVASKIRVMLAREVPSSKSFPHLREDLELGFLYYLDYSRGQSYLDFAASGKQGKGSFWAYKPSFSKHPLKSQGELFTPLPDFQGNSKRLWIADNPEYAAEIDENLRMLRFFLEGSGPLPGNYFVERKRFVLKRKNKILT